MEILVRDFTFDDFESINMLMNQVHTLHLENRPDIYVKTDCPLSENDFKNIVIDQNSIAILAENSDQILGFCIVTIRQPSKNPILVPRKIAYMEDLCVRQDYQNKGIGKQLYSEVLNRIKSYDVDSLELMVWSFNESAIEFYKNMGMEYKSYIMEFKLQ
jgi:diamine N-acetyltransferase